MSNISSMFAAGIEEVRKSWGWFFVCRHRADGLGSRVHRQGSDRDDLLYPGTGLGACHQRSCLARELLSGLDLGRILCVPAKRAYPRRDWVSSDPPPRRRGGGRHDGARCTVYRGRTVPRSRGERHSVPPMGMDGVFRSWSLSHSASIFCHLAHSQHLLCRHGNRGRPHL